MLEFKSISFAKGTFGIWYIFSSIELHVYNSNESHYKYKLFYTETKSRQLVHLNWRRIAKLQYFTSKVIFKL